MDAEEAICIHPKLQKWNNRGMKIWAINKETCRKGKIKNDFTVNRTRGLKIFSLALSQLSYEVTDLFVVVVSVRFKI